MEQQDLESKIDNLQNSINKQLPSITQWIINNRLGPVRTELNTGDESISTTFSR